MRKLKKLFFEIDAQRSNAGISFYFFQKYAIYDFLRTCKFFMFFLKNGTWESMRLLGAKSAATFGCMSMPFGCMSMDRLGACMRLLGACMRLLGAKSAATFGCMPDSR